LIHPGVLPLGITNNSRIRCRVLRFPKKAPELDYLLDLLFSFQRPTSPLRLGPSFVGHRRSGEWDTKHFGELVNKQNSSSMLFSVLPATEPSRAGLRPLWRDNSRSNRRPPYAQKVEFPSWPVRSQGSPSPRLLLA